MKDLIFYYNNSTSEEQNFIIQKSNHLDFAQNNIESTRVPNRRGDLVPQQQDDFPNVLIKVEGTVLPFEGETLKEALRRVNNWLRQNPSQFNRLQFSDEDVYSNAVYKNLLDLDNKYNLLGTVTLLFEREPFKKNISESVIEITAKDKPIFNPSSVSSTPIMKIYGSGDITLYIGDYSVNLKGIENYIILDSNLQDAYILKNGIIDLKNSKMDGQFPELAPGLNYISWSGNVSKIELTPGINEF